MGARTDSYYYVRFAAFVVLCAMVVVLVVRYAYQTVEWQVTSLPLRTLHLLPVAFRTLPVRTTQATVVPAA